MGVKNMMNPLCSDCGKELEISTKGNYLGDDRVVVITFRCDYCGAKTVHKGII